MEDNLSASLLYSSVRSPHCFKVSMVLHEKGVDCERIEIDLPAREQKTPAFLAINPLGQVPVFEDDQGVHIDSLAIMRYLDVRFPTPRLFPADPAQLQRVLNWVELSSGPMRDVSHYLYWQLSEPPATGPDAEKVAQLKAQGLDLLMQMEAALGSNDGWLCGELTAADISVFAWVYGYARFDLPPDWHRFPEVCSWLERLAARPSFALSFQKEGRSFKSLLDQQPTRES